MYIIPGFVKTRKENSSIFLTSEIQHNTVKISDVKLMEELQNICEHGCGSISSDLEIFLHDQELLMNEEEIEYNLRNYKKLMDDKLFIVVMPTEACNFRCPYCYEKHDLKTMSSETLEHIKQYIQQQISKYTSLQLNWYGGEPTLCKEHIEDLGTFVQRLRDKHKFHYHSNMTTNGYLLDVESFKKFYNLGITAYQITLDGWNHDMTRPHVSGKGTLSTIIQNLHDIANLPREQYNYRILIRHNILKGDNDFSWYDYLKELFGNDDRFSIVVRAVGDWGGDSVRQLNLINIDHREETIKNHLKYIDKIGFKRANGTFNSPFARICYANYKNSIIFRANGKLEKCTVCLDNPKNSIGYIDEKYGVTIDEQVNEKWSYFKLKPECYKCPAVLSCLNLRCKRKSIVDGILDEDCAYILSDAY